MGGKTFLSLKKICIYARRSANTFVFPPWSSFIILFRVSCSHNWVFMDLFHFFLTLGIKQAAFFCCTFKTSICKWLDWLTFSLVKCNIGMEKAKTPPTRSAFINNRVEGAFVLWRKNPFFVIGPFKKDLPFFHFVKTLYMCKIKPQCSYEGVSCWVWIFPVGTAARSPGVTVNVRDHRYPPQPALHVTNACQARSF